MTRLTYEQIEETVGYKQQESTHFMPNEIFDDLQGNISKSPHVAFAYSYYYLISWLYRNAKYGDYTINVQTIKELLNYSPNNKTVNYIIKNKGVLDLLGYTQTTSNYPVSWDVDEYNSPEFHLLNDANDDIKQYYREKNGIRFTVKYPIKHLHIDEFDHKENMKTGIFYDVSNTHMINFETFIHCMSIKDLGTIGFYIYSYLKMKNQMYKGGFDISWEGLAYELGLSDGTLANYMKALRQYQLIDVIHNQEYFSYAITEGRMANTYITNDPFRFRFTRQPYKKMKVKSEVEHMKIMAAKERGQRIAFGESPFDN